MRIGLDAHILGKGKGGVERVVHHMVRLLPDLLPQAEFVIFTKRSYEPPFAPRPNVRYLRLPVSDPLLQRSFVLPWICRRERLDLLHVQRAAPPCVPAQLIVHTHDLLPLTAPADHRGFRDRLVRRLTPLSLKRADRIVTVSQSVADEIKTLFPRAAGKVVAIPNGIEAALFQPKGSAHLLSSIRQRLGLQGEYVLYLGAIMSRKNLEVALAGYAQYRSRLIAEGRPAPKLVLAGMSRSAEYMEGVKRQACDIAADDICFAGFVTDEECVALLQDASVFLAPSRGEGFDLPALEAMSCRIPVVCSDIPVHRELLGNDALYFACAKPAELAARLYRLATDPKLAALLADRGPQRAATFRWEDAMQQMAALYHSMLTARGAAIAKS